MLAGCSDSGTDSAGAPETTEGTSPAALALADTPLFTDADFTAASDPVNPANPANPMATETNENTEGLTPDEALEKLKAGNKRFVELSSQTINEDGARRIAVAKGQKPFAGILGCVDSRVPPELAFDRGLGDLFVSRVAGAIADDSAIGSLEFGVNEFDIPLLVVLGHSKCGAVKATIEAVEKNDLSAPGSIGAVVGPIVPAVKTAIASGAEGPELASAALEGSINLTLKALNASPILSSRVATGKLKIVGAVYRLDSGLVEFL